jgi:hypothetical protein
MPIVFTCECRWPIAAPKDAAGLLIQCQDCGTMVRVPATSDPRLAAATTDAGRATPPVKPLASGPAA